jgi:hypothetical protein
VFELNFEIANRYFIIIDDVWKEEDWNFIKAAFPDNRNSSRLVVTTRITNVAGSCCSNSGDHLYQMPVLNDADSRRLFFKRIFHHDKSCPPELTEVSDKILEKCGGLPLAIISIASLLANKPHNTDEWEKLEYSIGNGLSYENHVSGKRMNDILLLGYWDLPHHLKTCLLYLCIYPEDHRIKCEDLKWKWIAEGFVAAQWGNLCQEAEKYFNELVNRNMIQRVDVVGDGLVTYCQVHDMVLDLIISLSEEEKFATVLNGRVCNSMPSKIRRLSMQSSGQENKGAINAVTRNKLHLRSLNVFGEMKQTPPLVDYHSLRVLDLNPCNWLEKEHIKNIASCSQLRYLRLNSIQVTELPQEIGKLQCLQTLDLRGCVNLRTLPSTMVRLHKLVYLNIEVQYFDQDFLNLLMAMPSLTHLQLKVTNRSISYEWQPYGSPHRMDLVTVGSNGFKFLNVFCFTLDDYIGVGIAFAPGAMPALRRLHICWKAIDVMGGFYADNGPSSDMGIEHLSSLAHLLIETDCVHATVAEVEAVERKATVLHPNCHTLQLHLHRENEHCTFKDKKERNEKVSEEAYAQCVGE